MRVSPVSLALTLAVATFSCNPGLAHPAKAAMADARAIAASIASSERPAADRERDVWAKPDVVLTLLGARPGMHVIDYLAADGYYSELLARIVGPKGQVILYNNDGYASYAGQELAKRFDGRHIPNVLQKVAQISELKLPPKSLDAALFVMSYHDVYYTPRGATAPMGDAPQMVRALFTAMKPGGVVVVQDHVANAGSDPAQSVDKMHRIDPAVVRRTFEEAGFVFDTGSDAFRNSSDDHSKLVFDPSIRHKTDQFLFRFRKPAH
ncbi:MAG: class I SAM-dependent methyltransferase [Proteobacteria bacterium]|nr:class I SAM-dependent methyltransferase [Pseudomonadota bacterium]